MGLAGTTQTLGFTSDRPVTLEGDNWTERGLEVEFPPGDDRFTSATVTALLDDPT